MFKDLFLYMIHIVITFRYRTLFWKVVGSLQRKAVKLLLIAVLAVLILSPFYISKHVYAASKGSTLGGVSMEGLNEEEAKELLQTELKTWMNGGAFTLKSKYEQTEISRSAFTFDLDASWAEYEEMTKRSWQNFFLKPDNVHVPLTVKVDEKRLELPELADRQKTLDHARKAAEVLSEDGSEIQYKDNPASLLMPIAQIDYRLPEGSNPAAVQHLASVLNGKVIKSDSRFSFLEAAKLPSELKDRTVERNFLASGLYELLLSTNVTFAEHYSQGKLPDYAQPGIEAAVHEGRNEDLLIINTDNRSYQIQAETDSSELHMSLLALPQSETFAYELGEQAPIAPRTVYRYSSSVSPGTEQVVEAGKDGMKVDVYRVHRAADGSQIEKKRLENVIYLPEPKVVLTSSQIVEPAPIPDPYEGSADSGQAGEDPSTDMSTPQTDQTVIPDQSVPPTESPSVPSGGNDIQPGTPSNPQQTQPQPNTGQTEVPRLEDVKPELKNVLQEDLMNACLKKAGNQTKAADRCKRESREATNWLLDYLLRPDIWSRKAGKPGEPLITKSPELNAILKGMK